jgi:hypothetical protein
MKISQNGGVLPVVTRPVAWRRGDAPRCFADASYQTVVGELPKKDRPVS